MLKTPEDCFPLQEDNEGKCSDKSKKKVTKNQTNAKNT